MGVQLDAVGFRPPEESAGGVWRDISQSIYSDLSRPGQTPEAGMRLISQKEQLNEPVKGLQAIAFYDSKDDNPSRFDDPHTVNALSQNDRQRSFDRDEAIHSISAIFGLAGSRFKINLDRDDEPYLGRSAQLGLGNYDDRGTDEEARGSRFALAGSEGGIVGAHCMRPFYGDAERSHAFLRTRLSDDSGTSENRFQQGESNYYRLRRDGPPGLRLS
jgi:hypothetical protein